jgi:hypothetical protein
LSFVDQLLPFRLERDHVRTIRSRIGVQEKKHNARSAVDPTWEKYLALDVSALQDSLRAELSRREAVHRRAQTFLSSIAVMTAFTIGATNSLRLSHHVISPWLMASGIAFAFFYLAGGGWYALATIRPGPLYDLFLTNRMNADQPLDDNERKGMLLYLVQMNQAYSLIFATLSERTYRCIRNGVIVLVTVLLMIVLDGAIG